MFKPFKWNYPVLRGMDFFFSSNLYPNGDLIRSVTGPSGIKDMFNTTIASHGGCITESWKQFFATEMGPTGIEENSLEKYCGKLNQIIRIYRWAGFDDPAVRAQAHEHLTLLRRRRTDARLKWYDWGGAIRSSQIGRVLFPWLKNNDSVDFCSENQFKTMVMFGLKDYNPDWLKNPPNPHLLDCFCAGRNDFTAVIGFKKIS